MRVVVVGLGTQGYKRKKFAGSDFVCSIDPLNREADYKDLKDVSLDSYDAALICTPDEPKMELARFCLENRKHILIEKPLWARSNDELEVLETTARENGAVCYTAYNHRFEPHFVKMKELINSGLLGEIYSCRMFYGNGTARIVRESIWRDTGNGVLPDLGSHLIDTCKFWFGEKVDSFKLVSSSCFENNSPDHTIVMSDRSKILINLEMTLCMWRNHFTCDILAEKGSAHIESLCKWGPSTFTLRKRSLPSGRPNEESITLIEEDPTWEAEYQYFKNLIKAGIPTDLSSDKYLNHTLSYLGESIKK